MATTWMPPRQNSICWGFAIVIPDFLKMVGEKAFKQGDITGARIHTIGQMVQTLALTMFFIMTLRFMIKSRRWLIHGQCEEKNWSALGWATVSVSGIMTVCGLKHYKTACTDKSHSCAISLHKLHSTLSKITAVNLFMDLMNGYTGSLKKFQFSVCIFPTRTTTAKLIPVTVVMCIWNVYYPGAFLPFEYCRFKFDVKKIEKAKIDNTWPLQISHPIRNRDEEYAPRQDDFVRHDDKGIEISLTELKPNKGYPRT